MMFAPFWLVMVAFGVVGNRSDPVERPAPGWYYLWAQCTQEPSTIENPALCDEGIEGEWAQALALSNVYYVPDGNGGSYEGDEYASFLAIASRRFGFDLEDANEVGPFDSFREAENQIVAAVRHARQLNKGLLAVTLIALDPGKLDDEPNHEEVVSMPSPLPPVMDAFKGVPVTTWRNEVTKSCGMILPDGTAVLPPLVSNAWGEDGQGCPRELQAGSGIYRFDVARNGAICGDSGVCTELFASDGYQIGVIDETAYPIISPEILDRWGLIQSGNWDTSIYSIPERRFLFRHWPGDTADDDGRVLVGSHVIVDDRPAIEIRREYRDREADFGYFWLDTMNFELRQKDQSR